MQTFIDDDTKLLLYSSITDYFVFQTVSESLNSTNQKWKNFQIPLEGNSFWRSSKVGKPSLSNILCFEFHSGNTTGSFTLWLDGFQFIAKPVISPPSDPPNKPKLEKPISGSKNMSLDLRLEWLQAEGATDYHLQIEKVMENSLELVLEQDKISNTFFIVKEGSLEKGQKYVWYVQASNNIGVSASSDYWIFYTQGYISKNFLQNDMTEGNAFEWQLYQRNKTVEEKSFQLYNDSSLKKVGNTSLSVECTPSLETWLEYTGSTEEAFDLSSFYELTFWLYTGRLDENIPIPSFKGQKPKILFYTSETDYFVYQAEKEELVDSAQSWKKVSIPLTGNKEWKLSIIGNPSLNATSHISFSFSEIKCGYNLWIDGFQFNKLANKPDPVDPPDQPILKLPTNGTKKVPLVAQFEWEISNRAESYQFYLEKITDGKVELMLKEENIKKNFYTIKQQVLKKNSKYRWYIRGYNKIGLSPTSECWIFYTEGYKE
jgi:hypothetical protein